MYYIGEYEKGSVNRDRVRDSAGNTRTFRFKRDAIAAAEDLTKENTGYIYKVWSSTQCPEGDCYLCMDVRCPVKDDDVEEV